MGILVAVAALTELLFSPMWGAWSGRIGRKRVLAVGIFGYGLSMVLMGLAHKLWMLIGARALSGVLTAATMPTAMAYVSDTTSEEDRGGGIGALGSAAGLGVILGPGLGGWLGGASLSLPFFIGAALAFVGLLLVMLLLPETPRTSVSSRDVAQGDGLATAEAVAAQAATQPALDPRRLWEAFTGPVGFTLLLLFIASLGLANFEAVFGLYAADRFGFGPERVDTILVVVGVVTTFGKGLLTGPLTKRFGEASVAKGSMIAGAAGYLVLLALVSKRASRQQGAMMGMGNTAISLARVIGPLCAGYAFDLHLSLPYLTGAAALFLGFVTALAGLRSKPGGS
ncbi:MAG: MFS transporter [Anaerolineae bacterium]